MGSMGAELFEMSWVQGINQRNEGIDLHGVAGALMATQNLQMQTFAAGFSPGAGSSAGSVGYTPEATPYAQLREQIEQYNTWLYEGKQIALTNAAAYEQPAFILTQYGLQDETFGIIYIPKLEVTLPLYLGANDENMANGAAVLGQTSVPIGGVNTNSVIAGHRGWNGYPYFLNLDELQIGDTVYIDNIWTLMKYEVVDIQVISPDDVDAIKIQEGRDLVTLLTCHPPNTGGRQRLLVFCERVSE